MGISQKLSKGKIMHQELMDVAYEKFDEKFSYEQWYKVLTEIEKKAVVLGNLNYQVENGGFYQWVDNGYVADIHFLIEVLEEMYTDNSKKIIELLNDIKPYVIPNVKNTGCFGKYLDLDSEEYLGDVIDLDTMDKLYYEINTEFMEECESYLIRLNQK
jgi:hypothetical protein